MRLKMKMGIFLFQCGLNIQEEGEEEDYEKVKKKRNKWKSMRKGRQQEEKERRKSGEKKASSKIVCSHMRTCDLSAQCTRNPDIRGGGESGGV